jgi:hypothetical protein
MASMPSHAMSELEGVDSMNSRDRRREGGRDRGHPTIRAREGHGPCQRYGLLSTDPRTSSLPREVTGLKHAMCSQMGREHAGA